MRARVPTRSHRPAPRHRSRTASLRARRPCTARCSRRRYRPRCRRRGCRVPRSYRSPRRPHGVRRGQSCRTLTGTVHALRKFRTVLHVDAGPLPHQSRSGCAALIPESMIATPTPVHRRAAPWCGHPQVQSAGPLVERARSGRVRRRLHVGADARSSSRTTSGRSASRESSVMPRTCRSRRSPGSWRRSSAVRLARSRRHGRRQPRASRSGRTNRRMRRPLRAVSSIAASILRRVGAHHGALPA